MADAELRALERRWRETGDPADGGRWLCERVRRGRLALERVWAGHALGHAAAAVAVRGLPEPRRALDQRLPRAWFRTTIAARLLVLTLPDEPLALATLEGALAWQPCAQAVHLLARAAEAAGCRRVVVDVGEATAPAPSPGPGDDAALLTRWARALRAAGGRLALSRPPPPVVALFAGLGGPAVLESCRAPARLAELLLEGADPGPLEEHLAPLGWSS